MGFFGNIIRARRYRQKESVTPDEFLAAMECDFGRKIDEESAFFFRHHSITVNLVNRILGGWLKQSGDDEKDGLVLQVLLSDMAEYTPGGTGTLLSDSSSPMADLVEEFSKKYKDAGNIIHQALVVFLKPK